MNRADLILGSLLVYSLATALHLSLAALIFARRPRGTEVKIFAAANLVLAAWHLLQLFEYSMALAPEGLPPGGVLWLTRLQLMLQLLVLTIFFQLFANFQRLYRRPPPSLRAAIITHVQRWRRFYVVAAWWVLVLALAYYAGGQGKLHAQVGEWRALLGPLSAYLFAGSLVFLILVLFPARPGQERVGIANLGRGMMLLGLLLCVFFVALWHDSHPARIRLAVLPILHIQSVSFVVFFGLVRYEFSFMDRYIRDGIRLLLWTGLSLIVLFIFNRIHFAAPSWGRYATSLCRLAVLGLAIAVGPALDRALRPWMDRVLFDRDVDLRRGVHRFSQRLSRSRSLAELERGALLDIQEGVHPKSLRLLLGDTPRNRQWAESLKDEEHSYRLRIPLVAAGRSLGWLLLGERRNCYPWFDAERRYLEVVSELLGSALDAMGAGEFDSKSGAAARARAHDIASEAEELRGELAVIRRELSAARRELVAMRERLDPELVESILRICAEVGERDPGAAIGILKSLRRVYAYILEQDGSGVRLSEEIAFVQDLLALEKLRLRNRLEVGLSLDPALNEQLVPRRVLQPLIDNALIHGLSRELHTGRIRVNAAAQGGRCSLTVEDNGRGFLGDLHQDALRGEGGLSRVLRAAQELYGDEVILRLDKPEEAGTRVCLSLPRRAKEHRRDPDA
jgi:hypothetical protein